MSGRGRDVEFVELRYSGRPAAFLRGFRALYLGLAINLIIMGWVNLGMAKILSGTLGIEELFVIPPDTERRYNTNPTGSASSGA